MHRLSIYFRFNKSDKNSDELQSVEKQCDRYKDVLQALTKKFVPPSSSTAPTDPALREKRLKKVQEYTLGQVMEDSCKDLSDGLLRNVLENCGEYNSGVFPRCVRLIVFFLILCFSAKLEKTIAHEIVTNELNVENEVSRKLNTMYDTHVQQLQKQKRIVTKCFQDNEVAKQRYQVSDNFVHVVHVR
jgi:Rho GTPase-activating protein 17